MTHTEPVDIGSRRELFVDRMLVDRMSGAALRMHPPQSAGVALAMDAPWEGKFSFYTTVLQDGDTFRMYYRGWLDVAKGEDAAPACTCLATSPDGVHWTRPELGLVEHDGSSRNNIILHQRDHGSVCHNFCPFLDTRPGVPEGERFKGLGGNWGKGTGGLWAYVSGDGVHWRRLGDEPVVKHPTFSFDSQNVAFWSEVEGCYVCYYRTWRPPEPKDRRVRWVSRQTSDDFVHWSDTTEMEPVGGPAEHLYTQQTQPYFRAPHIYIAPAARFLPGREVITEAQAREAGVDDRYWHDCSDGVLLTSRAGTATYDRTFMESFVRPGPGPEHWISRTNYPACGIVPTGEGEMSLYVNRRYAQPAAFVERMTLRTDGFASVNAGYDGGEFVTKPLVFEGGPLRGCQVDKGRPDVRVWESSQRKHALVGGI